VTIRAGVFHEAKSRHKQPAMFSSRFQRGLHFAANSSVARTISGAKVSGATREDRRSVLCKRSPRANLRHGFRPWATPYQETVFRHSKPCPARGAGQGSPSPSDLFPKAALTESIADTRVFVGGCMIAVRSGWAMGSWLYPRLPYRPQKPHGKGY
jgi:hypothetical protein